jgi:hypothetical protein
MPGSDQYQSFFDVDVSVTGRRTMNIYGITYGSGIDGCLKAGILARTVRGIADGDNGCLGIKRDQANGKKCKNGSHFNGFTL